MVAHKPILNHFPNTLRDSSVLTDDFTWYNLGTPSKDHTGNTNGKKAKTDTLFQDRDPQKPYCIGWYVYRPYMGVSPPPLHPNEEG